MKDDYVVNLCLFLYFFLHFCRLFKADYNKPQSISKEQFLLFVFKHTKFHSLFSNPDVEFNHEITILSTQFTYVLFIDRKYKILD